MRGEDAFAESDKEEVSLLASLLSLVLMRYIAHRNAR